MCATTSSLLNILKLSSDAKSIFHLIMNLFLFQSLDLNGSGLSKLKPLSSLSNLKKLIVSFNELTSLQDLSGMV